VFGRASRLGAGTVGLVCSLLRARTNMKPKISVVTPVLNGRKFIARTVESVVSQVGDFDLEYIIRDGLSTDGTLDVLREYADHPCVTIVSEKDSSLYDAIQKGMASCTGDIGCWINGDDYYEAGAFQAVVDAFARSPRRLWLYGLCDIVDDRGRQIRKPITWYKDILGFKYYHVVLLCENYINQPATFWKMDLWRSVGGLSMKYRLAADYELWLRFSKMGEPLALHRRLAHFRRHGGSVSDAQFELQFREEYHAAAPHSGALIRVIHGLSAWKTRVIYRWIGKA
jgi:glycosyltransferase involved in cell wall biosynthesis